MGPPQLWQMAWPSRGTQSPVHLTFLLLTLDGSPARSSSSSSSLFRKTCISGRLTTHGGRGLRECGPRISTPQLGGGLWPPLHIVCSSVSFYSHLFYVYTCALAWPGTVPAAGESNDELGLGNSWGALKTTDAISRDLIQLTWVWPAYFSF